MTFLTLAAPAEARLRERGSVFLAYAAPAGSEEEARASLAERARLHPGATHHGSAWTLRGGVRRANDAGEPGGSAGAPILAAIEGAGLVDAVVVVTRWYGGTKLGVGGLVRAYGDAAAAALAAAPLRDGAAATRVEIAYGYDHTSAVMRALERAGAVGMEHDFDADDVRATVAADVPDNALEALGEQLRAATSGAVAAAPLHPTVLYRQPS